MTTEQIRELRDRMFQGSPDKQYPTGDLLAVCDTAFKHAETIRHICQTVHQANGHEGEPRECRKGVCDNLKTL